MSICRTGQCSLGIHRRELAYSMWNTDAFGWQESPIRSTKHSFFLATRRGLRDVSRQHLSQQFDFGKERARRVLLRRRGRALDYYFFYGPEPKQVVERSHAGGTHAAASVIRAGISAVPL